ncbi:MAG: DUF5615 family PIN-like protein [Chloroflexi bacterium]|nr:DUF5615 family PIN-like protein [Chloroflexota bacterium]
MMATWPPPAYLDECVDYRLAGALREWGFTVSTALEAGALEASDEAQLAYATTLGCVTITHNRAHFRRLHLRFLADGRRHGGIIVLPQRRQPFSRLVVRAAMMLRWIAARDYQSSYFQWNDLQQELLRDHRGGSSPPGFLDFPAPEIGHALGWW